MRSSAWLVCVLLGIGCSRANPLFGDDGEATTGSNADATVTEGATALGTGKSDSSGGGTRGMDGTEGPSTSSGVDTVSLDGPVTTSVGDGPLDTGFSDTGVAETGVAETGVAETGNQADQCCSTHLGPGCGAAAIDTTCVCLNHPSCCKESWHLGCVAAAVVECGLACEPLAANDCCEPSLLPGCSDWNAMVCACDIDPLCCIGPWSPVCVSQYAEGCGVPCAMP